jgi:hypothetical protein
MKKSSLTLAQRLWRFGFVHLPVRHRHLILPGVDYVVPAVQHWAESKSRERMALLTHFFGLETSRYWRAFWWAGGIEDGARFVMERWKIEAPETFPRNFDNFAVMEMPNPEPRHVAAALLSAVTALRFARPTWMQDIR